MPNMTQIISRLIAVFIASAIPNVGVGAMLEVDAGKAMIMSGAIAVLGVVQQLAVAMRDKGTITHDDLDKAVHSTGD